MSSYKINGDNHSVTGDAFGDILVEDEYGFHKIRIEKQDLLNMKLWSEHHLKELEDKENAQS